eukprot:GEMP01031119.1.p1 GENE.GEMP01031119.1~~GEMP01031119.1.p1  ORF type:complete len:632 (-),score=115.80 GEMP01031119.1:256-2151(-)
MDAGQVPSLSEICVKRLVEVVLRFGLKKIASQNLSLLPSVALVRILHELVLRNALNDNVLIHCLGKGIEELNLNNCFNLRRSVLQTIGRTCPDLRKLDLTGCKQAGNRIVHEVLLNARHLQTLTLNGCVKISDSAFTQEPFEKVLFGLLSLQELNLSKCSQVSMQCLRSSVLKSAPVLRSLNLSHCSSVTNADLQELFWFDLDAMDISNTAISDEAFVNVRNLALRKLFIGNTGITDASCEVIAKTCADLLLEFDVQWCNITDRTLEHLSAHCPNLRSLVLRGTNVTSDGVTSLPNVDSLNVAMCLNLDLDSFPWPNATHLDLSWLGFSKRSRSLANCQFHRLRTLRLDGMVVGGESLRRLCAARQLRELGLTVDPRCPDAGAALGDVGTACIALSVLVLEMEEPAHTCALAWPRFPRLKALTLRCGLADHHMEQLLTNRQLEHLHLQAPKLSLSYFQHALGREEQMVDDVDFLLSNALDAQLFGTPLTAPRPTTAGGERRLKHVHVEHPVATCFQSLLTFHLTGPGTEQMDDKDALCLAECLPHVTVVHLEAPRLTKNVIQSFLSKCRFLRRITLRLGEYTHSWSADKSGAVELRRRKHRWARIGGTASASEGTGTESCRKIEACVCTIE